MGVSRSDSNKVVQRAKQLGKDRKKSKRDAYKQSSTNPIIHGKKISKRKAKKIEQRKRLIPKEMQIVKEKLNEEAIKAQGGENKDDVMGDDE